MKRDIILIGENCIIYNKLVWRNKKKAIKGNNFQNASYLNMINLCKNWKIFENKLKMEEKYEKNIFVVRNNVSWTYEGRNITISDNLLLL